MQKQNLKIPTTYLNFVTITLSTSKPWVLYSSLVCKNNKGLCQTIIFPVFMQVSDSNCELKITICSLIKNKQARVPCEK